jgi:hypothetical protein
MRKIFRREGTGSTAVPLSTQVLSWPGWISAQLQSSTSGIALLWVGWVIVVFYAVLWALSYDEGQSARQWQTTLMMMSLGQSAILTGLGLAIVDGMVRRQRRNSTRSGVRSLDNLDASKPDRTTRGDRLSAPARERAALVSPLVLPDGSVLVQTRLGQRRFRDIVDATSFVGALPTTTTGAQSVRH